MSFESRPETVVLSVQYSTRSSYYLDWLDALVGSPLFAARAFNLFRRDESKAAARAIRGAELVVALHSCSADTLVYLTRLVPALQQRRGRFLMFVGNEYNLPWARIADRRALVQKTGADWVATQLPWECGEWLYAGTGARVLALPHALNEAAFRREREDADRPTDIGSRGSRYPIFLGDDDRNRLLEIVAPIAAEFGLVVDIDTTERLDRASWAAFLNNCRGTVGTEAGSWFLERDDRTVLAIREYVAAKSGRRAIRADSAVHTWSRRLPYSVKTALRALLKFSPIRHEAVGDDPVSFDEIMARFFEGRPRAPVYSKCISSRHFDAAGTGTCQILMRGRYNDILLADEHYIPLDPDLANLAEAIGRFCDPAERGRIADAAYTLVRERHTYRHRMSALREMVSA